MNWTSIARLLGTLLIGYAVPMLLPVAWAVGYAECSRS
jgi:hypothetical protein